MGVILLIKLSSILITSLAITKGQKEGDSLQSALKAIIRRQRDLPHFPQYEADNIEEDERLDDLAFLGRSDYQDRSASPKQRYGDYTDYGPYSEGGLAPISNSISSSFRERIAQDKVKEEHLNDLAKAYLESISDVNKDRYDNNEDDDDDNIVRELWERYKSYPHYNRNPSSYPRQEITKRQYYPNLGWDSIGLRKRRHYADREDLNDYFNRNSLDLDDDYSSFDDRYDKRGRIYNLPYVSPRSLKRYSLTKRSSSFDENKEKSTNQSNNSKQISTTTKSPSKDRIKVTSTKKPEITTYKPDENGNFNKSKPSENKEVVYDNGNEEKPLNLHKKSIDWSDYFGLDRRKKSDNLNSDWLLEKYHKAVAATDKRDTKYQLKNFKNHDDPQDKNRVPEKKDKPSHGDQPAQKNMDQKLKTMEDSIIDDAIKYTGAHEGETDPQDIQDVKDRVISRLAAAYNLEKMRKALEEYRQSIAKEKQRMLALQDDQKESEHVDKRVSVPRKQAIIDDNLDFSDDNNIKCVEGDDECEKSTYKSPKKISLANYDAVKCPKVERACKEMSQVLGHNNKIFQTACVIHQMCMLCDTNDWFAPIRQCNVLFMAKMNEICNGDMDCLTDARRTLRYMINVNGSLRAESMENCDLICPAR